MVQVEKSQLLAELNETSNSYAVWRLPDESDYNIVISDHYSVIDFESVAQIPDSNGFIITPFDIEQRQTIFIPGQFTWIDNIQNGNFFLNLIESQIGDYPGKPVSKHDYLDQANRMINLIKEGQVEKVILSRLHVEQLNGIRPSEIFEKLCRKYPGAYVFWYYTPVTGLWMGASPELFVEVKNGSGKTVALAGTRKNFSKTLDDAKWHQKEIEEQEFVTSYIEDVLNNHEVSEVKKEGPVTISTGHLSHIKTTFSFKLDQIDGNTMRLLKDLHPTPAVCGLPKMRANKIIKSVENHNREYYGGFIGWVDNDHLETYVNIRSMKIIDNDAILFIGGGLTKDSVSELEWDETVLKAQTLLSVLKNI